MDETKAGARHSASDQKKLQDAHDALVNAGALCNYEGKDFEMPEPDDMFVNFGSAVKSLNGIGEPDYAVIFGGNDLTGDYFDKNTEYGFAGGETKRVPILFHHAQPLETETKKIYREKKPIGEAELQITDDGLLIKEAILYNRKKYEAHLKELGWSTGAAGHAVIREPASEGRQYVKQWLLGELSLTPTSAEPRISTVVSLKSLLSEPAQTAETEAQEPVIETKQTIIDSPLEGNIMDEKQIVELVENTATTASQKAIEGFIKALPETKGGFAVTDEADRALEGNPFKSAGEYLKAVMGAETAPHDIDKRLLPLKATGLNEAIPSQGGFLVPPQYAGGIKERMYNTGAILSRLNIINVSGNSMVFNAVDETSRATGSRKGGIRGYWLGEGATKTASKPAFNQVNVKLNKIAAVSYATDELLADTNALSDFLMRGMADELRFLAEDAVVEGDGVGKPLGILSSPALISATRTDATEVDALDIGRMWARRWAGANDYVWLVDPSVVPQLSNMSVGNYPVYLPAGGYAAAPLGTIYGRPVLETEYTKQLGTLGDIMLVSFSEIAAIAKGGVEMASSIHINFLQDEQAFRAVYRFGAQPFWYSAVTPFNGGDTVSPFVALAATT